MRALRIVGITEDGGEPSVVLEDSARQERFTVPADEQLRAAARGDLTRLGQISIELESQLRPREIQARIRAGASVDQVAAAAGVPAQKIERFAYPVLLERSRTAEVAQRAHPVRADGPDTRMLADVVAHTFGLRGQEFTSAEWDSWKGDDGRWVVALSWRAGRSDNRALWTFQPGAHGGTVTAVDEHAHDLVEGLPARPLRTVGPVIEMTRSDEQPPPFPEEGHELRAAASDIAARRDVSDWSRVAPEPRRPESRRSAADGYHPRRSDEPATEWPTLQRQPGDDRPGRRDDGRGAAPAPTAADAIRADSGVRRSTGAAADPGARSDEVRLDAVSAVDTVVRTDDAGASGRPAAGPAPTDPATAGPATAGGATPTGPATAGRATAGSAAADPATPTDPATADPATPTGPATAGPATPTGPATSGAATAHPATPTGPATADPAPTDPATAGPATPTGPATGDPTTADAATPPGRVTAGSAPVSPSPVQAAVPSARSPQPESAAVEGNRGDAATTDAPAEAAKADTPSAEPPAPRQAETAPPASKRTRKGKPVMPSWDEVLLGVRSQR